MPAPAQSNESTPLARVKRHAVWLLVGFFVALTYFAARNLTDKVRDVERAEQVRHWTATTLHANRLVHELQKERGLSSGLLSSRGQHFATALHEQRGHTDVAIRHLREATASPTYSGDALAAGLSDILDGLQTLAGLRAQIADLRISREAAADRYSATIAKIFATTLANTSVSLAGDIFRQQAALLSFARTKEMAGQERALVTAMLLTGDFGPIRTLAFTRIKAMEEVHRAQFELLAEEFARTRFATILTQPFVAEAERIRRLVVATGASGMPPSVRMPGAVQWFDITSRKIDAMSELEWELGERLLHSVAAIQGDARTSFLLNLVTVLISLALAIVLLLRIRHGKDYAEKRLHLAASVFEHNAESIMVTDAADRIVDVNPAFSRITGYGRDEALGRSADMLRSGRHDAAFYRAMWERIGSTGYWEGEIWNRRKSGEIYPVLLSIVAVRDAAGAIVNYIAMMLDLTKYKQTEALLEHLRTFDPLTGLPNRDAWHSAVDQAVANARRNQSSFAVLDIGLDRFKLINESLGHAVGDQALVAVAERIKQTLRRHDIAARTGGDRFTILLADGADPQTIGAFCERILAAFAPPVEAQGHGLTLGASIGIAIAPADGGDTRTLLRNAESALNRAKEEGRGGFMFYAREMNAAGAQLITLERMLRQALANGEFSVVYQPQIAAAGNVLVGFEALLRWNNPVLGFVSPVQFIPIAEATGLIAQIGEWVLNEACQQTSRWQERFDAGLPVAVNLSARQFRREDLMATVQMALDRSGLPAHLLELEITEGTLMADPAGAAVIMDGLRWMGVKLALDDFGTGYSSLAYLKNFPLDRLKLDRAFVADLPDNASDKAIANTVIALGHNLGLQVLAEGVETEAQAGFLHQSGCDIFQGYFFGKPMSPAQIEAEVAAGRLRPARPA